MQVQVQKFTRTTRPRSSAGPSGSELSHSVAPCRDGMCTRPSMVASAQRAERLADVLGEPIRLLPRREVPAPVVPVVARVVVSGLDRAHVTTTRGTGRGARGARGARPT